MPVSGGLDHHAQFAWETAPKETPAMGRGTPVIFRLSANVCCNLPARLTGVRRLFRLSRDQTSLLKQNPLSTQSLLKRDMRLTGTHPCRKLSRARNCLAGSASRAPGLDPFIEFGSRNLHAAALA